MCAGDVLIVHSSLKAIGWVEGGPIAVVNALKAAVSPGGTVLVPVFTAPQPDGTFDVQRTPSRTGLITETFRTSEGTRRSLHPTHSVAAWGERSAELVAGHDATSGLGVGSPFHKAAQVGASVLMIGCGLTACSLVHVAEAIVGVPYLGKVWYPGYERTLTLIDYEGRRHEVPPRDVPADSAGFTVVSDELERRDLIRHCKVGAAVCIRFSAVDCLSVAADLLRADPAALLCHKPSCSVCSKARGIVQEAEKTKRRDAETQRRNGKEPEWR